VIGRFAVISEVDAVFAIVRSGAPTITLAVLELFAVLVSALVVVADAVLLKSVVRFTVATIVKVADSPVASGAPIAQVTVWLVIAHTGDVGNVEVGTTLLGRISVTTTLFAVAPPMLVTVMVKVTELPVAAVCELGFLTTTMSAIGASVLVDVTLGVDVIAGVVVAVVVPVEVRVGVVVAVGLDVGGQGTIGFGTHDGVLVGACASTTLVAWFASVSVSAPSTSKAGMTRNRTSNGKRIQPPLN
jgi:hypothetical protein